MKHHIAHVARLHICSGVHLDDADIGSRYLIAQCVSPQDGIHNDPDVASTSWAPPMEDPEDSDPIGKAYWAPLEFMLMAPLCHHGTIAPRAPKKN